MLKILLLFIACSFAGVFAQELPNAAPKKLVVNVSGASDDGINKFFANKLLAAAAQSGRYAPTGVDGGADVVCEVSLAEAFGEYSIFAALKTADSQVLKTASLDRSLKSLDDITRVSNELAHQLFEISLQDPAPAAPFSAALPLAATPVALAVAAKKECESKLNINEIIAKIQHGFPAKLKDCSGTLAKNMALEKSPFHKGTKTDPVAFMKQCPIDGIKAELPSATKYVERVETFVQKALGAASSSQAILSAVGDLNVMNLLDDIKKMAAEDPCIVDEPYEFVAAVVNESNYGGRNKEDKSRVSLGFRLGFNYSHFYTEYYYPDGDMKGPYEGTPGLQLGVVFDIPMNDMFRFQPGLMYIQKGAQKGHSNAEIMTLHYIEAPLLLSLKISALRINTGPYFALCVNNLHKSGGNNNDYSFYYGKSYFDFGTSVGVGVDIRKFYIGAFYDYGLFKSHYFSHRWYNKDDNVYINHHLKSYNRTLGLNMGVNL